MDLDKYLKRIKLSAPLRPDLACLNILIEHQVCSIPFENFDQQMGTPVSLGLNDTWEKIVDNNRGGWCFELNHVLYQVLQEIGFDVQIMAGYVGNDHPQKGDMATHMFLLVDIAGPLLVDVGFGGALIKALPLNATTNEQMPYSVATKRSNQDIWQYSETTHTASSSFNFNTKPVKIEFFRDAHDFLQTSENSPFTRTFTAQRRFKNKHMVLRGRVLKTYRASGVQQQTIETADELNQCLQQEFDLNLPEIKTIWPKITDRHQQLFSRPD